MDISDEDLITQYLEGNESLLKILIDRYAPLLYNFSARFVGPVHAPDIVQEVFIKVWRNMKRFDVKKARFKTWIFTITRNTITDYLRKKKSIVFSDLNNEEEDPYSDSVVDDAPLPDIALEKLQDKELLESMIAKLPTDYQTVLLLYYQEDMTFAEIGEMLSKPLNTVKSHHRRALEQLRKMVL
jgi:RNA polymerase sigma-70 factor, ECF subfamily